MFVVNLTMEDGSEHKQSFSLWPDAQQWIANSRMNWVRVVITRRAV